LADIYPMLGYSYQGAFTSVTENRKILQAAEKPEDATKARRHKAAPRQ